MKRIERSTEADFARVSRHVFPGGVIGSAYAAVCRECGRADAIRIKAAGGQYPQAFVEQRFRNLGWTLGSSRRKDTCPACSAGTVCAEIVAENSRKGRTLTLSGHDLTEHHPEELPQGEPEVINGNGAIAMPSPTIPPAKTSSEPARQPTRDQRMAIHENIGALYDTKAGRYLKDWSDEALSKKMNLPRAWIAEIREAFFGPDINEDAGSARSDLEALKESLQKIETEIIDALTSKLAPVRAEIARLDKRLSHLEKRATP